MKISFGSPLTKLALDEIKEEPSHIRLLALLIFGNVFPSELIANIITQPSMQLQPSL